MKVQGNLEVADKLLLDGNIQVPTSSAGYFLGIDPTDSTNTQVKLQPLPNNIGGPIFVTNVTNNGGNVVKSFSDSTNTVIVSAQSSLSSIYLTIETERGDSTEYVPTVKVWGTSTAPTPIVANTKIVAVPTTGLLATSGTDFTLSNAGQTGSIFTGQVTINNIGSYPYIIVSNGTIARYITVSTISAPTIISCSILSASLPGQNASDNFTNTAFGQTVTLPWGAAQTAYKDGDTIQIQVVTAATLSSITLSKSGLFAAGAPNAITSSSWTASTSGGNNVYTFSATINAGGTGSGTNLGATLNIADTAYTSSTSAASTSVAGSGTLATIPYNNTYPSINTTPSGVNSINYTNGRSALAGGTNNNATLSFIPQNASTSFTTDNIKVDLNTVSLSSTIVNGGQTPSTNNNSIACQFTVIKTTSTGINNVSGFGGTANYTVFLINPINRRFLSFSGIVNIFENASSLFGSCTSLYQTGPVTSGTPNGNPTVVSVPLSFPILTAPSIAITNRASGTPNVITPSSVTLSNGGQQLNFTISVADSTAFATTSASGARGFTIALSNAVCLSGISASNNYTCTAAGFVTRQIGVSSTIIDQPIEIGTMIDAANLGTLNISAVNQSGAPSPLTYSSVINNGEQTNNYTVASNGHSIQLDTNSIKLLTPATGSYTVIINAEQDN